MTINEDNEGYYRFTGPMRLDKELHTIGGLLRGIQIDGIVEEKEIAAVRAWMTKHAQFKNRHPFNEIIPALDDALADGVLETEEIDDILWLCESMTKGNRYFDRVTSDMQRLQGILGGIVSDSKITEEELRGLTDWMDENDHLRSCWPYDEIEAVVMGVMKDGKIDHDEHERLLEYFFEFVNARGHRVIEVPEDRTETTISGVCAVCPEIEFPDRTFCFTGKSQQTSRSELEKLIGNLGGNFTKSLVIETDYLIIGGDGNPCWAYACYGRKVETAVKYRKQGRNIAIVHEFDFWDAAEDVR